LKNLGWWLAGISILVMLVLDIVVLAPRLGSVPVYVSSGASVPVVTDNTELAGVIGATGFQTQSLIVSKDFWEPVLFLGGGLVVSALLTFILFLRFPKFFGQFEEKKE